MLSKAEHSRQQIIRAADDLFYRQGFEHTSFTDIADAAGIGRGNFYYYFKTKDELLSAVIIARCDAIRHMLEEWDEQIPDPRQRLQRYLEFLLKTETDIEQHGCPVGSLCTELAKLRHTLQYAANDMFEQFRIWLRGQFTQIGYTHEKADELALHLLARTQGVALVANAYHNKHFMQREIAELIRWLAQL